MDAYKHKLLKALEEGDVLGFVLLLSEVKNINSSDTEIYDMPLLHHVAGYHGPEFLDILLSNGAPIHEVAGPNNMTLLHQAATNEENPDNLRLLLSLGADKEAKTFAGYTPLHMTCMFNLQPDCVEILLEAGADIHASENAGKKTPLHLACEEKRSNLIVSLLRHGARTDLQDKKGNTPLHNSSYVGSLRDIKVLLDHGATVNTKNNANWLPIHNACHNTYIDCVNLLLEYGSNINATTSDGNTPLHFSCVSGNLELSRILVTAGANVRAINSKGYTPLQTLYRYRGDSHKDLISLLISSEG